MKCRKHLERENVWFEKKNENGKEEVVIFWRRKIFCQIRRGRHNRRKCEDGARNLDSEFATSANL